MFTFFYPNNASYISNSIKLNCQAKDSSKLQNLIVQVNSSKHIEMHNYSFLGLCGFSSGETKGSMAHFHFENVLRERTCKWNHLSCWPQALFPWDNRMATLLLKPLMLTLENGCPLNKPDRRHDYLKMTCCLLLGQREI